MKRGVQIGHVSLCDFEHLRVGPVHGFENLSLRLRRVEDKMLLSPRLLMQVDELLEELLCLRELLDSKLCFLDSTDILVQSLVGLLV